MRLAAAAGLVGAIEMDRGTLCEKPSHLVELGLKVKK
jgi:hypothetical protein